MGAATAAAETAKALAKTFQTAAEMHQTLSTVALLLDDPVSSLFFTLSAQAELASAAEAASQAAASTDAAEKSMQIVQQTETLAFYSKWAGRAGVVLTVGLLGYEFYSNIRMYYKGEIDATKCA